MRLPHRKTALTFLAAAAVSLAAGCSQRQPEDVPPLNADGTVPASSDVTAQTKAWDAAKANAAGPEVVTPGEADKAAQTRAWNEAQDPRAKAEAEARAYAAAQEAAARERSDAVAKAESERAARPAAPVAPAVQPAAPVVVAKAPEPAAPAMVAKPAETPPPVAAAVVNAEAVPAAKAPADAAAAAREIAESLEIPAGYDVKGRKTIVQVDRARSSGDVVFDKGAVTKAVAAGFDGNSRFVTTNSLYASSGDSSDRAIYLALEPEAKALGLISTRRLTDAPSLLVKTVVGGEGSTARHVTVTVTDSDSGKVVATGSRAI